MGLPVFAANLDARKCFHRIWHDALFYRLIQHLSVNCWLLVVYWYRHLSARVSFGGTSSEMFSVVRGTRQGAILSPAFANVFLHPLLAALDDSGCGAFTLQHHVPAVCYADDLLLLSTSAKHLSVLLGLVSDFARGWRLEFVHPNPVRQKAIVLSSAASCWHGRRPGRCLASRSRSGRSRSTSAQCWFPGLPLPTTSTSE